MRTARSIPAAVTAAALTTTGAATAASAATDQHYRPGTTGVGDHWFPSYGNGGYDARHYAISLSFRPDGFHLAGAVTMTARATQNLSRFSLDLDGMTVREVAVDGRAATFRREGHELVVTPGRGIDEGRTFRVRVRYAGSPQPRGTGPMQTGFLRTDDVAFTVTNDVASDTLFPNIDTPSDKATYRTAITVPRGRTAVSNGTLASVRHSTESTTYRWHEGAPMASYLCTVDIGRWQLRSGRTPSGIPEYVAVDPQLNGTDKTHPNALSFIYDTTAQVTDQWARKFGAYPFDSTGGIADFTDIDGQPAGFSEETQTRPVYGSVLDPVDIAHELAHQWFGDSVSITDFSDIWLNEGFATWAAWYWDGEHGGTPVEQLVRRQYAAFPASSEFWAHPVTPAVHDPGNQANGARIYLGGAMALQFLRERVGDATFFAILRTWTATYRHANATTADFVRVAERISGQDLRGFFQRWIYGTGKPSSP